MSDPAAALFPLCDIRFITSVMHMNLTGKNIIAGEPVPFISQSSTSADYFTARGTTTNFEEATAADVHRAFAAAEAVFDQFRGLPAERRALFLEAIAEE